MKKYLNHKYLPLLTLGAGGLGLVLRIWYFASRDAKGLLAASHFANTMCYLLFAAALAIIALTVYCKPIEKRGHKLFNSGAIPATGCVAGAVAVLYACIVGMQQKGALTVVGLILGIVAAAGLALLGLQRFQGKRPNAYLYVILVLYLAIHVLLQVRLWNKETQPSVIFFPLLASLFSMICVYYHARTEAQRKLDPAFVMLQYGALLTCCMSLNDKDGLFYLGMAAFLGCNLHLPKPSQPAQEEE